MSFERAVLGVLEEKGLTVDERGHLVRIPGYSGPHKFTDDQLRLFNERHDAPSIKPELDWDWVNGLTDVIRVLIRDGEAAPWPWPSLFWTRLLGLLTEIPERLAATFKSLGIDPHTHAATPTSPLEWTIDTYLAIEALRKTLTDDELVYLDFRRNAEGHPRQDSYAIKAGKNGTIKDTRTFDVLEGRALTLGEVRAAIERVEAIHGTPQRAAIAFAKRIVQPFGKVHRLMQRGHGVPRAPR